MKPVTPCYECSNCAIGYGVGFTGGELLHCAAFGDYVTREDGCTKGTPGEPSRLCDDTLVTLGGHEAVHGW